MDSIGKIKPNKIEAARRVSVLMRNRDSRMTVAGVGEHVVFLAGAVPLHKTYHESAACQQAVVEFMHLHLTAVCTTKKDLLHWYGVVLSDGDDQTWRSVWTVWVAYNDAFADNLMTVLEGLVSEKDAELRALAIAEGHPFPPLNSKSQDRPDA